MESCRFVARESVSWLKINSGILLQRQKMERHMGYWFKYKAQRCDNLWWHQCSFFGFQEFLNVFDKGQHHKEFLHDTQTGMGFTLCNHHKKHPRLEIGLKSSRVNRRIWEGQKEVRNYSEDLIYSWIGYDNNNRVNFYQFKHYPDDNKKSQWKGC